MDPAVSCKKKKKEKKHIKVIVDAYLNLPTLRNSSTVSTDNNNSRGLHRLSILQPTRVLMIAPGKAVEPGEPFSIDAVWSSRLL